MTNSSGGCWVFFVFPSGEYLPAADVYFQHGDIIELRRADCGMVSSSLGAFEGWRKILSMSPAW